MPSGSDGSASGASDDQVDTLSGTWSRPGEVPEQPAVLVPAALDQRELGARRARVVLVVAAQPRQRVQRQRVQHVDQHVLDVLVVAGDDDAGIVIQTPRAFDEPEVAGQVVAHPAEHGVVLR